jgi:hypothetical protein
MLAQTADGLVGMADRRIVRMFDPSWVVRLTARMRSRALDRALIGGADPAATPQLAAHAARLTTRSMRTRIAEGLERLARAGGERPTGRRVLPFRAAVQANTSELVRLAALLRGPAPVYAGGVAMLRQLLTDGTGPAYTDRKGEALARELRGARVAIGGLPPSGISSAV